MMTQQQRRGVGPASILMVTILVIIVGAIGLVVFGSQKGGLTPSSVVTTTITTATSSTGTPSSTSDPIQVVSVIGPIPPYNPGGPVVTVTLENAGGSDVTSLNATLGLDSPPSSNPGGAHLTYSFVFNVTSSDPLQPGQSVQATRTLIDAEVQTGANYPLTIDGTLADGQTFSYAVQVQIVPPSD